MSKQLPAPDLSTADLFNLPDEIVKWQIMKTALQLKIFDYLSSPLTAEQLSNQLNLNPDNCTFLLKALVALGCLDFKNNTFQNTASAEDCWKSYGECSLSQSFLFMSQWSEPILNDKLTELVKNGAPPPTDIADDAIWKKGAYASLNHTRCLRAQKIAEIISKLPEFANMQKMLDLGAGSGIIGIAITMIHPTLECVLYDQPAVCEVADEVIAEYDVAQRVRTLAGDYMKNDFENSYDLIIANYTLNFYKKNLNDILKRIYDSLNPGGLFFVASDGLNKSKTSPAASVISWFSTAVQGNEMSFSKGEISQAMFTAGFKSTERFIIDNLGLAAHGPIEITIGRK